MRLLIIEDELELARAIRENIKQYYVIDLALTGEDGLNQAYINEYDAIILDIGLPDIDGLEVCKQLRANQISCPILILTGLKKTKEKIQGLDAGADDYLTKPFSRDELLARLRALTRRPTQLLSTTLQIDQLCLDTNKKIVHYNNQAIKLNKKEIMLLELLMRNQNKIVTRATIIDHIWDKPSDLFTNSVDVYINSLRKKIDKTYNIKFIKTIYRLGYKIVNTSQKEGEQNEKNTKRNLN